MALNLYIQPKGIHVEHLPGKTILESALAAGISLPHSCDAGSCHICTGKLIHGSITLASNTTHTKLSHTDTYQPEFLCCKAYPNTDCTLEINNVLAQGELPLHTVACQVKEVLPLNHDVTKYEFKLPAGKKVQYHAGQYLELVLNNGTENESVFPFSIANAQNQARTLELHIREVPNSASLAALEKHLNLGDMIHIRLPKGDCTMAHLFPNDALAQASNSPLLFLAGSTGFAPVKAMIEYCLAENIQRPIYLYWGGRTVADIYLHELAESWAAHHEQLKYVPVISEPENNEQPWDGRTGFVHKAVMEDFLPFSKELTIIAGGSPGMVHAAYDDFIEAGLDKTQLHSDVFAYAPK